MRSDCGDSPSHDSLPVDCAACPSQLCQAVNCRLKSSGNSRSTSNWDRLEIGWCIHICAYTDTDLVYQRGAFGIMSTQVGDNQIELNWYDKWADLVQCLDKLTVDLP